MALFLMETSSLGRKEGALGVRPLRSSHVISIIQMVRRENGRHNTAFTVKSHWVQDVPLAYSVPGSTQNGQGIQEQRSFPRIVTNSRSD
jgi:hypothetical protein